MAYLTKDTNGEELLNAIRNVHCGLRYLPHPMLHRLAERMPVADLTPRESEVLICITRGRSNREIAEDLRIAEKTVRIHVSSVLDKMGVRDRTQATILALQRGLIHLDLSSTLIYRETQHAQSSQFPSGLRGICRWRDCPRCARHVTAPLAPLVTSTPAFPFYDAVGPIIPIRADLDRIFRITVCTRPFRAAGPRQDVERVGDKYVVHNYGHGGSGWSLPWGSADVVVRKAVATLAESSGQRDVAVIGAGALGLTAALTAQRAGLKVTIYARERAPMYGRSARRDHGRRIRGSGSDR